MKGIVKSAVGGVQRGRNVFAFLKKEGKTFDKANKI